MKALAGIKLQKPKTVIQNVKQEDNTKRRQKLTLGFITATVLVILLQTVISQDVHRVLVMRVAATNI